MGMIMVMVNYPSLFRDDLVGSIKKQIRWVFDQQKSSLVDGKRQVIEKDAKRDVENTELKSRIGELEASLAILEQGVTEVNGQPQNDKEVIAELIYRSQT
ncbi:hypothetical protein GLOIN_2v1767043 [Rhizophagus irregularis DAOM 181602=DAOM 197198]|nr:hypothetical protein GLOIN_2v1767043 [Rhizophagus irregularis DAOM 181602=DAOM 197198]